MNQVTREIAEVLQVSLEKALQVQYAMDCEGIDYSECTTRQLHSEAKRCLKLLNCPAPPSKGQPMTDTTEARAAMNPEIVEVVAADREAAADYLRSCCHTSMADAADLLIASILSGEADHDKAVQAFARHRIAALTTARAALMEEAAGVAYDYITDGELAAEVRDAIRAS